MLRTLSRPAAISLGLLLGSTAAVALAAPGAAATELKVAIAFDMKTSEPGAKTRDTNSDTVLLHVVESLVAYREDLTVAPMLARSIDVSPDGTTYTFKLRPGLVFHNGAPVTATEVKWSWDRILDPKTDWLCRDWYDGSNGPKLLEVRAVDAETVTFRLERASPLFLDRMANLQCITAVLHPSSVNADGSWKEPVGTGPFTLAGWNKGQSIELKKFAGYVASTEPASGMAGRKQALVDGIRWVVVPERAAQKAGLLAGEIDVLPGLAPADLPLPADRAQTMVVPGLDWNALLLQTGDPVLKDPRIRRAIAMSIDRAKLAEAATGGTAKANPSPIASSLKWHTAAQEAWPAYDPAAAKKLLAEAGYRGQPLKLQANKRFPNMYDNAVLLQAMLLKAGITAELEVLEWATQLANYREGRLQMMSFGFSARTDPLLAYASFLGDKAKAPLMQWDDPAARKLFDEAGTVTDPAQRQAIFDRLQALLAEQVPIIPLYNQPVIDAVRPAVQGYAAWTAGRPRLWNVALR